MTVARVVNRLALVFTAMSLVSASAGAQGAAVKPTLAFDSFQSGAFGPGSETYKPLEQGVQDLMIVSMARNANITVVERARLNTIINEQNLGTAGRTDPSTAARIGRLVGAQHYLMGSFLLDARGGSVVLTARSVNTETGTLDPNATFRVEGKSDDIMKLLDALADTINRRLSLPPMPVRAAQAAPAAAPAAARPAGGTAPTGAQPVTQTVAGRPAGGAADFKSVLLYAQALEAEDKGDKAKAIQLYTSALTSFPDFDAAKKNRARLQGS